MSDSTLEKVTDDLRGEVGRLAEESCRLKEALKVNESLRKRAEAALRALGGNQKPKPSDRKPSASKADVIGVITSLLTKAGVIPELELRRQVERHVTASGKSRMGLALRMKEALADSRFTETEQGYQLAARVARNVVDESV